MKSIEIKSLSKKYKDLVAVDNLSLSVEEGELYSLLGVNGAGKSTTVNMLCGLTNPTSGDAFLLGFDIKKDRKALSKLINVSPQETAIAPKLSVWENLLFVASIYGIEKGEREIKTKKILAKMGLEEVKNKKAELLSGGMKRRLSIALALISDPKILFLDEPTLGLDVLARRELWKIIKDLKGKITIVLTTHYMEEAEALSDRVGIMAKGKLVAEGTPSSLLEQTGATSFEDAFVQLVSGGAL